MNINNIIKLIKAYFYENWQKDVLFSFLIVMVLAMLWVPFQLFDGMLFTVICTIMVVLFPTRAFGKLHHPASRMHYLMIPANNNEKVVANMFLANVYFVAGMIISIIIGTLLGNGIQYLRNPEMYAPFSKIINDIFMDFSGEPIMMLFLFIAISFFASIYFKKSPFWKMILTLFVISVVISIIMGVTEWLNALAVVPEEIRKGNYFMVEDTVVNSDSWLFYLKTGLGIVYFYAMSFLRMRETEA